MHRHAGEGRQARAARDPARQLERPELTSLTITIRGAEGVSKVRSVERGELKFTQLKGGVQINMPLNVADILLIDR